MSNSQIRILIAEDSAVQAEAIRRTLVAEGYSVIVAKDGADGLAKAKELKPELVVSDIMMPEMNGFELCKHIKNDADLKNTPVILLTSLSDPADVISGLECGADNFITKPYEGKYLISRIRYMLLSREFKKDERTQMGVEIYFAGQKYFITSEKKQILDLLISTYESAVQKNLQLVNAQEELQALNEQLEQKVEERTSKLMEEITERKRVEAEREKLLQDLGERVKELTCINEISRLAEKPWVSIEEFVQGAVGILPPAWRYPEICAARITLNSKEFKTANFRETEWSQVADIKVDRKKFGAVTICYLEEKPAADEGPFLKEERSLLNTVADFLGHIIQHRLSEAEIRASEEKFRMIFDNANDGILLADMESKKFLSGNATICRMLGYSQEEIKNTRVMDIHPEKDIPYVIEQFEKQSRKEIEVAQDLPMKRKDGSFFYADVNSSPVEISGKRYLLGIFRDVTERKQAEEELRGEKSFIEDALDSLSDVFFVFGLNGKFLRWNKTMNAVTGYDDAEISSMQPADFFLKEDRQRVMKAIEIAVRVGYATVEARVVTKEGRHIPYEFTGTLLRNYEGNPIGVCGVGRDITERKQAEEKIKEYTETLEEKIQERTRELEDTNLELQVLNKELDLRRQEAEHAKLQSMEASRAKSDFLANMSHELRTPLNSIIGFSEILKDELYGKLNEKQREYVSDVLGSGAHLLELINDILDLSKVESGKLELELSRFPLKDILNISMTMLREKALKHNINLSLYIKPDADVEIEADERKLKQIMFNLLSNALKFTPDRGSVSMQARLIHDAGYRIQDASMIQDSRYKIQDKKETDDKNIMDRASCIVHPEIDLIEISVLDTGIGIKQEDMDKLFKEFSQIESVYTKTHEGTGLGLALTKRLVELLGGRIWVESEFGKGSKFTFVIPIRQDT